MNPSKIESAFKFILHVFIDEDQLLYLVRFHKSCIGLIKKCIAIFPTVYFVFWACKVFFIFFGVLCYAGFI